MLRLTTALVTFLAFAPLATASLTPRKDPPGVGKQSPAELLREEKPAPASEDASEDLVISDQTEILLDGEACKYEDVPAEATIILLELASNKKDIRKIHFKRAK